MAYTNRNSFMSLNKVWLSIKQSAQNFWLNKVLWTSSVPKFYPNRNKNTEITDKISPIPVSKIWLSLHQFSWNSQVLKGIRLRSSVSNFTQIDHKIWKVPIESQICPSVICNGYCANFREIQAYSTAFCKQLLYPISTKSDESFSRWS